MSMQPDSKQPTPRQTVIIEGHFKSLLRQIDYEAFLVNVPTKYLVIRKTHALFIKPALEIHQRTDVLTTIQGWRQPGSEITIVDLLRLDEPANIEVKR